ncbi:helix-turn-helix domain-containing protein [Cellvibrio sp.]|uniref:helix-turn-helix domain-containing protein n=1 Tax=Cellvibrio sp. TaxID=1965322 RepID=UPI00374FF5B1
MRHSRNSKNYAVLRVWLKSHRVEAGLTVRTLAEKLEVPHSIVGKIEDGSRKMELFEFVEYCRAVGVDPRIGFNTLLNDVESQNSELL